jgi:LacI family transcriptional regulator
MAMVAARAGVHTGTISLALRNHPRLPLKTRQRLQALANEMGYQRDPALSALIAYRSQSRHSQSLPLLAYVTNWESRWGWKEHREHLAYFEGAQRKATELGYQLEHFWLREEGMSHRRMSQILHTRGIPGIILAAHEKEAARPIDFEWSNFSAVRIAPAPCVQPLHAITSDQRAIVALAVQRAMAAGYHRIGFVTPFWWDEGVARATSTGFLGEQLRLHPDDRIPILYFPAPAEAGPQGSTSDQRPPHEPLSTWLRTYRPEVIIGCGAVVKAALGTLGISVPKDVALVDTNLETPDGITAGIHPNCQCVGELAADILAGLVQKNLVGIPAISTATLVEGTWHDGASLPLREGAVPGTTQFVNCTASPRSFPRARERKLAV